MVFRTAAAFQNNHTANLQYCFNYLSNIKVIIYKRRYILSHELPVPQGGEKQAIPFKNQVFLFPTIIKTKLGG